MLNEEREITFRVPAKLFELFEEGSKGAGFDDPNDFFLFILREIFNEEAEEMEKAEKDFLEQRLRDLGYM